MIETINLACPHCHQFGVRKSIICAKRYICMTCGKGGAMISLENEQKR